MLVNAQADLSLGLAHSNYWSKSKWVWLRGYIFQKLLLARNFSCINKKCFLIKETYTFGHIVVWTIYTSHIDHFTPQHTAFEQSAACLSVFLESLPGFERYTPLRVHNENLIFLFLNQNICCRYSKGPSLWDSSFSTLNIPVYLNWRVRTN